MPTDEEIRYLFTADDGDLDASISVLKSQMDQLRASQERVNRSGKQGADTAKKLSSEWDTLKASGRAAGGRLGEMGERLDNLKLAMTSAAGAAAIVTVGVTALTAAGVGAAAAYVSMARATAAMADELEESGRVSRDQAERLRDIDAAMTEAEGATDSLRASFALLFDDELKQGAAAVSTLVTALATMTDEYGDFAAEVAGGLPFLRETFALLELFNGSEFAEDARERAKTAAESAKERAAEAEAVKRLTEAEKAQMDLRIKAATDLGEKQRLLEMRSRERIGLLYEEMDAAEAGSTAYDAAFEQIRLAEMELAEELRAIDAERTAAREAELAQLQAKLDKVREVQAAFIEAAQAELASIAEVNTARNDAYTASMQQGVDAANSVREAMKAGNEDQRNQFALTQQTAEISAMAIAGAYAAAAGGILAAVEGATEGSFAAQKALAVASVLVNTGAAIMQAAASVPWPYSLVPMGLMAATGAVQLANIGSTQLGGGGAVSRPSTGGAATAGAGQGGQFGSVDFEPVDGTTARTASSGAVVAFGGRMYDVATGDALRRDSTLARALAQADGSARGQRRRR